VRFDFRLGNPVGLSPAAMVIKSTVKKELRIEVLEPNTANFMLYRKTAPEGVTVSPLQGEVRNALDPHSKVVLFFFITWTLVGPTLQEIVGGALKDIAKERVKEWAIKFITNLKARRIRINNQEPKDASDLERIISKEIEIGKND
jgi:hypothetical protein